MEDRNAKRRKCEVKYLINDEGLPGGGKGTVIRYEAEYTGKIELDKMEGYLRNSGNYKHFL